MTTSEDIPADVRALVEQSLKQFAYHYTYVAQNPLVETTRAAKHARSVALHAILADRRARPDRAEVLREALQRLLSYTRLEFRGRETREPWTTAIAKAEAALSSPSREPADQRPSYELQGTGYDPGARGYELQGRDAAPSREPPLNTSAEPVSKAAKIEHEPPPDPSAIRICPRRDGPCPHGMSCTYWQHDMDCSTEPSNG